MLSTKHSASKGPGRFSCCVTSARWVCQSLDKILELPFEILWKKKDKQEIDVEDEDWAAAEEEHRESAVIGMTALSIGKITKI